MTPAEGRYPARLTPRAGRSVAGVGGGRLKTQRRWHGRPFRRRDGGRLPLHTFHASLPPPPKRVPPPPRTGRPPTPARRCGHGMRPPSPLSPTALPPPIRRLSAAPFPPLHGTKTPFSAPSLVAAISPPLLCEADSPPDPAPRPRTPCRTGTLPDGARSPAPAASLLHLRPPPYTARLCHARRPQRDQPDRCDARPPGAPSPAWSSNGRCPTSCCSGVRHVPSSKLNQFLNCS